MSPSLRHALTIEKSSSEEKMLTLRLYSGRHIRNCRLRGGDRVGASVDAVGLKALEIKALLMRHETYPFDCEIGCVSRLERKCSIMQRLQASHRDRLEQISRKLRECWFSIFFFLVPLSAGLPDSCCR